MSLDTMQDLLLEQLKDIYSAETQLTKALPKLVKAASHPSLTTAIQNHLAETKGQIQRLDRIFEMLDEQPNGKVCKGMKGLIDECNEALKEEGEESVIDAAIIANAQRVEHYEISAYGTARALAELLQKPDIVELLDETLAEEKAADEILTQIAEEEVNPMAVGVGGDEEEE